MNVERVSPLDLVDAAPWSRALLGSYVISLSFFEAALLPALRQAGARDIRILADLFGVAGALGESGAREVGRTYALDPVRVTDGVFHPKFLLLQGQQSLRLIVGSGNLTFGGWGRNLELAEFLDSRKHPEAFDDMADFLDALIGSGRTAMPSRDALGEWRDTLLELGGASEGPPIRLLHSLRRDIASQLAEAAAGAGGALRLSVASPYYGSANAVIDLAAALGVDEVDIHVGDRLCANGTHFDFAAMPGANRARLDLLDAEKEGRPLHAKLIEIECADATMILSGSVNASRRALSGVRNVELAVLRYADKPLSRRPHIGDLAALPPPAEAKEKPSQPILHSSLIGEMLKGEVLSPGFSGEWRAWLDAEGARRDLGDVRVGEDGGFEIRAKGLDNVGFGRRRAVLSLERDGDRVRGFVTFPDLLALNRSWGAGAGHALRVIGGSDDDEDLAGVLEYFARYPNQTSGPWRRVNAAPPPPRDSGGTVALSDLEVRPDEAGSPMPLPGMGATALDRMLAALRGSLKTRPPGRRIEPEEPEDPNSPPPPPPPPRDRTSGVFEQVRAVLGERVPHDPETELHRLGDLAVCVLARSPDQERILEFADWWTDLAAAHLRVRNAPEDLTIIVTLFVLLDAFPRQELGRARNRLARILGNASDALSALAGDGTTDAQLRLVEEVAGHTEFEAFAAQVRQARSPTEELRLLLVALDRGMDPPALPILDLTAEMTALRSYLARDKRHLVAPVDPDSIACPYHSVQLPDSNIERFRSLGLAFAGNCCRRIMIAREAA